MTKRKLLWSVFNCLYERVKIFVLEVSRKVLCDFVLGRDQAPVVRRLDKAIHRINRYPVDKC